MGAPVGAQQAAGADHEQRALHTRFADRVDHATNVVLVPFHRDDDDVVALQDLHQRGRIRRAAGADGHALARRQLARIARDGGHVVLARQRLVENAAADVAGGADQGDVGHLLVPFMRSRSAATVAAGASCGTLWPIPGSKRRSKGPLKNLAWASFSETGLMPSWPPCRLMVGTVILGWSASRASTAARAGSPGA